MMMNEAEQTVLEKFAEAANEKVLASQADLDPKDRAMPEMLAWCRQQGNLVVLNSARILTSEPGSRTVQNCKSVMLNLGIRPKQVCAATPELIHMLLANALDSAALQSADVIETVSEQQQRLRILVKEALAVDASDIHVEVRQDMARIRFRKHGELYLHAEWLPKLGREIASVAFNKETDHAVSHFNPTIPQNASMPLRIDDKDIRLRLASMPAHGGFDMVMRLLATEDESIPALDQLGYLPEQIEIIKKAINMPHGAVIVSGPTGSGKTTTLASCVNMIGSDRKVYTIEDPVEKVVEGVTQVPVNMEQTDRGFASMGRAALRMDPDVMVLGEMRDLDTATVLLRASVTGHLVFSTLHTNSAPGIITRLVDMGISSTLLSSPNLLACLICQRLIPTLCETCAVPVTQSPEHQAHLSRWQHVFGEQLPEIRARGKLCKTCHGLGISGRTVIAEVIWVDEIGRRFIQQGDTLGWEKHLKEHGWISYRERALDFVRQGLCDPMDVEKMIGEISTSLTTESFDYRTVKD